MYFPLSVPLTCELQGGKGRTGVFISAFLLWSGHRRTALDALELFTFRRSENYKPEASNQFFTICIGVLVAQKPR
jgi:hypothetical protein